MKPAMDATAGFFISSLSIAGSISA